MLCYQQSKSLSCHLKTLTDFDYVICVDGKHNSNEGPALSDDGTRDIIMSFPNTILIDAPWLKQIDARNLYIKRAAQLGCSWLLVLEANEYITNKLPSTFVGCHKLDIFKKNLSVHQRSNTTHDLVYSILKEEYGHVKSCPRLLYKPQYIRYSDAQHSYLVNSEEQLLDFNNNSVSLIKGIFIHHGRELGSQEDQVRAQEVCLQGSAVVRTH
jgi:hypothetical protein